MLIGKVYSNSVFVGIIYKDDGDIVFEYAQGFLDHAKSYDISFNLPRTQKQCRLSYLHPFFSNMLSEGSLRRMQCRKLGIDEEDEFMVLLHTTKSDVIGAITIAAEEITELSEVIHEVS